MNHLEKMRDAIYKNQIGRAFTEMLQADSVVARQYFNDSFSVVISPVDKRDLNTLWWWEAFVIRVNDKHAGNGEITLNTDWPDSYHIRFSSEKKWLVRALCMWFHGTTIIPYTNYQGIRSVGSYFTAHWDVTLTSDRFGNESYETSGFF